ncbi:hypothetical protein B0H63DRAFT_507349 [Podospora didyma]|uniref:Uncharacterized protein n=1 Tax=Podospora didyma TaxID=330526 RepID=A0AAE0NYP8_9PEZI|nr:hypothetical protein B0H63DRAFT_507349 [Podospora didyma]
MSYHTAGQMYQQQPNHDHNRFFDAPETVSDPGPDGPQVVVQPYGYPFSHNYNNHVQNHDDPIPHHIHQQPQAQLESLLDLHPQPQTSPPKSPPRTSTASSSADSSLYEVELEKGTSYHVSSRPSQNHPSQNHRAAGSGGVIGTLKPRTFWLLMVLISITVIAISIGAGIAARNNTPSNVNNNANANLNNANVNNVNVSTFPNGTARPLPSRDCPQSDGTTYTSAYTIKSTLQGIISDLVTGEGGVPNVQGFIKQCGGGNTGAEKLASAFVLSFDACIELCASLNYFQKLDDGKTCTQALYDSTGNNFNETFPVNCWAAGDDETGVDMFVDFARLVKD